MKATRLLNDDGTASMATMIMLSHHAFRRDIGRFARALDRFDPARTEAVQAEWKNLCEALHGHHMKEDSDIFPHMREEHPELGPVIDRLGAQHAQIDPLLERGEQAIAKLPDAGAAAAVVRELARLVDAHLDDEEATIIPQLRGLNEFPAPSSEEEAAMYAGGFAWAMDGIAPSVLAQVQTMLPEAVCVRLSAARAEFEARCDRVWGSVTQTASETSIPAA